MIPRWITTLYLVYLAVPIVLLVVGSFGDLWLNTLLPSGATSSGTQPWPPIRVSAARSARACSSR